MAMMKDSPRFIVETKGKINQIIDTFTGEILAAGPEKGYARKICRMMNRVNKREREEFENQNQKSNDKP